MARTRPTSPLIWNVWDLSLVWIYINTAESDTCYIVDGLVSYDTVPSQGQLAKFRWRHLKPTTLVDNNNDLIFSVIQRQWNTSEYVALMKWYWHVKCKVLPITLPWRHRTVEVQRHIFFNLGPRRGWVFTNTPRSLYIRGRDPVPTV